MGFLQNLHNCAGQFKVGNIYVYSKSDAFVSSGMASTKVEQDCTNELNQCFLALCPCSLRAPALDALIQFKAVYYLICLPVTQPPFADGRTMSVLVSNAEQKNVRKKKV